MPTIIASVITGISSLFKGVFSWKTEQANTVQKSIEVIGQIDTNDAQSVAAFTNALQNILTQGSFLERNWRSWLMTACVFFLIASFYGYVPPHFNDPLSPQMERIYHLIEIGLGGYIVRRGIVDIVRMFNIGSIVKTLIEKKVL